MGVGIDLLDVWCLVQKRLNVKPGSLKLTVEETNGYVAMHGKELKQKFGANVSPSMQAYQVGLSSLQLTPVDIDEYRSKDREALKPGSSAGMPWDGSQLYLPCTAQTVQHTSW